ncbi:MAG: ankyrin repeat domain-containing protein [bacterium]|nr:ankyrin repeat domain-containing protein [bacterium]
MTKLRVIILSILTTAVAMLIMTNAGATLPADQKSGFVEDAVFARGRTPLMEAALTMSNQGCLKVRELLNKGANVNACDDEGRNALMLAIVFGYHYETPDLLLNAGIDIVVKDNHGQTALMLALRTGNWYIAKKLMNRETVNSADKFGETPLLLAAGRAPAELVEGMLQQGAKPDFANIRGVTPLMLASFGGRNDVVTILLRWGANVNAADKQGRTALAYAVAALNMETVEILKSYGAQDDSAELSISAFNGDSKPIRALLDGGTKPDKGGIAGRTPLFYASLKGNADISEILIKRGACTQIYSSFPQKYTSIEIHLGDYPLFYALNAGNDRLTRILLATGDIPYYRRYWLPFSCAQYRFTDKEALEIIDTLLKAGLSINLRDAQGMTSLHCAVSGSNISSDMEALLERGAEVDIKDNQGNTPLMNAARHNSYKAINILIARGSAVDTRNNNGETAIMLSVQGPVIRCEALKALIAAGADVNAVDNRGKTSLVWAVNSGNQEAVSVLLKHKADHLIRDINGKTALDYARRSGQAEIIRLLAEASGLSELPLTADDLCRAALACDPVLGRKAINAGISVNSCDNEGNTPIILACMDSGNPPGRTETIGILLAADADVNVKGNKWTPLYLAVRSGWVDLVQVFLSRGAATELSGSGDVTPLGVAYSVSDVKKSTAIARLLIDAGANVNVTDSQESTPLMNAVDKGDYKIAALLLSRGAEVNRRNWNGITALMLAAAKGYDKMVDMLLSHGADAGIADIDGQTACMQAFFAGKFNVCDVIRKARPDDDVNKLFLATLAGDMTTVRNMFGVLQPKSERVIRNAVYLSSLAAIRNGNIDMVKIMLEKGWNSKTSFVSAMHLGVPLKIGDITTYSFSAVGDAAVFGRLEIMKLLLDSGALLDTKGGFGEYTALTAAIDCGHEDVAIELVNRGADFNIRSAFYGHSLTSACSRRYKRLVKILLEKGTDINTIGYGRGYGRSTALIIAIRQGDVDMIKYLLKRGADISIKDEYGKTALDWAKLQKSPVQDALISLFKQ